MRRAKRRISATTARTSSDRLRSRKSIDATDSSRLAPCRAAIVSSSPPALPAAASPWSPSWARSPHGPAPQRRHRWRKRRSCSAGRK
jgi:hypothetical protein